MSCEINKKIYPIVVGRKDGGTLKWPFLVGHAYQFEGNNYYLVKFLMFPEQRYYLVKSDESQTEYKLFSDIEDSGIQRKFQSLVGLGSLGHDLKTHLQIKFPLLRSRVFMDLHPSDAA
jgi:hypothetical protein